MKNRQYHSIYFFATFFEARPFLEDGNYIKIERNIFYKDDQLILIVGIGKDKINFFFKKHPLIEAKNYYNFGFCGGVKCLKKGDVFIPDLIGTLSGLQKSNVDQQKILVTVANPVLNSENFLNKHPYLNKAEQIAVDMEVFYLKNICDINDKTLVVKKVVSDLGAGEFFEEIKNKKEFYQNQLKKLQ